MAREYLVIYPENNVNGGASPSNWGAFPNTPAPVYIQLTDSNAFTLRPSPVRWTIRSAGGYNRRVLSGSFKTLTTGALNNLVVFGGQASSLWFGGFSWLMPYSYTASGSTVYELPSCSIDHVIADESGSFTQVTKRYLGVKVAAWSFTSNSDASLARLSLTSLFAKSFQNSGFSPAISSDPAYSSYPSDPPYVHQHASSDVTFQATGGTPNNRYQSGFDQFTMNVRHMLDPRFFNSTQIAYLRYCGRDVDYSVTFPYLITPVNDRVVLFESSSTLTGVTPVTAHITYSIPGTGHTFKFNFQTNSLVGTISDDLNFNQLFMQNLTGWSQVDSSSLSDFTIDSVA